MAAIETLYFTKRKMFHLIICMIFFKNYLHINFTLIFIDFLSLEFLKNKEKQRYFTVRISPLNTLYNLKLEIRK